MPRDQKTGDPLLDALIEVSIVPAGDGEWLMVMVLNRELPPDAYRGVMVEIGDDEDVVCQVPYGARLKFTVVDGTVVHAMIVPENGAAMPLSVPHELLSPFGDIVLYRAISKRTMRNARSKRSFGMRPTPPPTSTPTE